MKKSFMLGPGKTVTPQMFQRLNIRLSIKNKSVFKKIFIKNSGNNISSKPTTLG